MDFDQLQVAYAEWAAIETPNQTSKNLLAEGIRSFFNLLHADDSKKIPDADLMVDIIEVLLCFIGYCTLKKIDVRRLTGTIEGYLKAVSNGDR